MAVQIPFPVPSAGYALNSQLRINLDFLVDTFNQFNTGTATWDNVSIGIANNETGTLNLFNASTPYFVTLQAGSTAANNVYTWPTAFPIANAVLMTTTSGTLSWATSPTLSGLTAGSLTINSQTVGLVFEGASGGGVTTIQMPATQVGSPTLILPSTAGATGNVLSTTTSGNTATLGWTSISSLGGANQQLSNLSGTVAINQSLNNFSAGTITASLTGAASSNLLLTGGTLTGALTINPTSNQLVLGTTKTITITAPTPAASTTYTIGDMGTSAQFVMDHGIQTLAGQYTFNASPVTFTNGAQNAPSINLGDSTTGFYRNSANQIAVTISGTAEMYFSATSLQSNVGFSTPNGQGLSLYGAAGYTLVKAASGVSTWTLTLPTTGGSNNYVLTTDGSGTTSWSSISSAGGANNLLSNLSTPVAINQNLNNFSAGTITASLTGHASLDLPLTAGSSYPLSGNLYTANGIVYHAALGGFKQIQWPNDAISWTATMPSNHGTTGQALIDSDGAGTLGWGTVVTGGPYLSLSGGIMSGNIAFNAGQTISGYLPLSGGTLSGLLTTPTIALTAQTLQIEFSSTQAHNATLTVTTPASGNNVYTIPDPGTGANICLDQGNYTIAGNWTFSNILNGSSAINAVTISGDHGLRIAQPADNSYAILQFTNHAQNIQLATVNVSSSSQMVLGAPAGVIIGGTNTNDSAPSGYVGEYLVTGVGSNWNTQNTINGTLTFQMVFNNAATATLSLTAGDWDVTLTTIFYNGSAKLPIFYLGFGFSTTAGGGMAEIGQAGNNNLMYVASYDLTYTAAATTSGGSLKQRVSLSSPATYYANCVVAASGIGSLNYKFQMSARRVR